MSDPSQAPSGSPPKPSSRVAQAVKVTIFSLLPAVVLFSLLEACLKLAGFQYSDTPLMMARIHPTDSTVVENVLKWNNIYGSKADGVVYMLKDPKQLWVPRESFEQRHELAKPAGVVRIATLGDSCTAICIDTDRTYPAHLDEILNAGREARKVEVLNAGVGSHSSFQGLQRLRYSVLKFKPDILTVYFGWNDHWVSNTPDSAVRLRADWEVVVLNFLEKFRTYQAYHYLIAKLMRRRAVEPVARERAPGEIEKVLGVSVRVPVEEYAQNLESMIGLAREKGIKVLLVTAPYDLARFEGFSEFPFSREALIAVHERYNGAVREVAARLGVPLLDLAAGVATWTGEPINSADGIHFTPFGCRFIAERFADKLRELQWVP